MTSFLTLAEALAEVERAQRELDEERTQRQRLEDELKDARRLEALGRLAGSVAHDFSNILAVISGHSELMLRRMDPTDSLRTGAESIRKAAVWGLNLTRHVWPPRDRSGRRQSSSTSTSSSPAWCARCSRCSASASTSCSAWSRDWAG